MRACSMASKKKTSRRRSFKKKRCGWWSKSCRLSSRLSRSSKTKWTKRRIPSLDLGIRRRWIWRSFWNLYSFMEDNWWLSRLGSEYRNPIAWWWRRVKHKRKIIILRHWGSLTTSSSSRVQCWLSRSSSTPNRAINTMTAQPFTMKSGSTSSKEFINLEMILICSCFIRIWLSTMSRRIKKLSMKKAPIEFTNATRNLTRNQSYMLCFHSNSAMLKVNTKQRWKILINRCSSINNLYWPGPITNGRSTFKFIHSNDRHLLMENWMPFLTQRSSRSWRRPKLMCKPFFTRKKRTAKKSYLWSWAWRHIYTFCTIRARIYPTAATSTSPPLSNSSDLSTCTTPKVTSSKNSSLSHFTSTRIHTCKSRIWISPLRRTNTSLRL